MVDPVTIGSAAQFAITLAKLCFRISQNISRIQRVDATVVALGKEIDGLKSILDKVEEIGNVSSETLAGPGKQHIESMQYSLGECRETLEKMDPIFRNLNNTQRSILRPWKSIKFDWKADEIAQFRHEVGVCQNRIDLDLMMITCYSVLANESQSARISRQLDEIDARIELNDESVHQRLDQIKDQLTPLVNRCRSQKKSQSSSAGSIKIIDDLHENCLRNAEHFLSAKFSTVSRSEEDTDPSQHLSSDRATHLGSEGEFTEEDRHQVENWIPPVPDQFGDMYRIYDRVAAQMESEVNFASDGDAGIEFDMIQKLKGSADDELRSADYEKAEKILKRVLKSSEEKYGKKYRWREETVERLGVCCSKQGRWEDAESFFLELLLPASQTEKLSFDITHSLAEVYLGMGDFRRAEIFCKKAIEGRTKLFGKEHGLYYRSITLLAQIYETNNDPIGAESCRSMLPLDQFNRQRVEIERLSWIKAEDAAAEIGVTVLEHLLPEKCRGRSVKWAQIRANILMARRISGSGNGYCLLHAVAKYGDKEALIILLEKGANVNAVDKKGNTGLHLAARGVAENRKKIAEILLGNRADPSIQREDGRTALMIAIQKHNSGVIGVLLEKKMDLDVRDGLEWSALHYAAFAGDEDTTSMLLKNGANVDLTGRGGRTALHCASLGGKEMVVLILLQNKANVKHKDNNGQTAADLAKKQSHDNIMKLLRPKIRRSLLSGSTW